MADWNMSWKDWVAGDAAPTADAVHAHPPLPHDAEPKAPAYQATYTPPPTQPSSPSPSPSPHHSSQATASPKPHHSRHH
jgi:hypothetical protein